MAVLLLAGQSLTEAGLSPGRALELLSTRNWAGVFACAAAAGLLLGTAASSLLTTSHPPTTNSHIYRDPAHGE